MLEGVVTEDPNCPSQFRRSQLGAMARSQSNQATTSQPEGVLDGMGRRDSEAGSSRQWGLSTANGISARLSQTAPVWGKLVAPWAVARALCALSAERILFRKPAIASAVCWQFRRSRSTCC
jgi:hypothetical protein